MELWRALSHFGVLLGANSVNSVNSVNKSIYQFNLIILMKSYFYNNIKPRTRCSTSCGSSVRVGFNIFNRDDSPYMSLEDKIKLASEDGADIGVRINPQFDDKDSNDLDVTCSFRHDVFDIAEEFGRMPVETAPPADDNADDN